MPLDDKFDPDTGEVMPADGIDAEDEGPSAAPEMDAPEVERDTLYGDVRDALLSRFRNTRKSWDQMSEQEQRETVEAFSTTARHVVREAVRAVTDYDFPRCVVTLGAVQIKDKQTIEAKISCQNIEDYRSVLGEAVGEHVLLLAVDSDDFMAARSEPKIDVDQPDLDLTPPEDEAA